MSVATTQAPTRSAARPGTGGVILRHMLRTRRMSTLWWTVALALTGLSLAALFPSLSESIEDVDPIGSLPEGVRTALGADAGLGTPDGYLMTELFATTYPVLLLILGVGLGTRSVAGAERAGSLEPLLANPVSRTRVALERFAGTAIILAVPALVSALILVAVRDSFELGAVSAGGMAAAFAGAFELGLLFAAVSFAAGAGTGRRELALAGGAGLAAATYLVNVVGNLSSSLGALRWASPWYWFVGQNPVSEGWSWPAHLLPLAVVAVLVWAGTWSLNRRDLRL